MVRLKFIEYQPIQDRHDLKPKVGEAVMYEGVEYLVVEVGLRYAKVRSLVNPKLIYLAKFQDLQKKLPPGSDTGVNPLMNYNP